MNSKDNYVHPAQDTYDAQTLSRQNAFLAAFATLGTIYKAADAVGISRETPRTWKRADVQGFEKRFATAKLEFGEYLEDMALQRIENPAGKTGSDLLMIAMLNANLPEKWRPNQKPATESGGLTEKLVALTQAWQVNINVISGGQVASEEAIVKEITDLTDSVVEISPIIEAETDTESAPIYRKLDSEDGG